MRYGLLVKAIQKAAIRKRSQWVQSMEDKPAGPCTYCGVSCEQRYVYGISCEQRYVYFGGVSFFVCTLGANDKDEDTVSADVEGVRSWEGGAFDVSGSTDVLCFLEQPLG